MNLAIIDYGAGNIFSVQTALRRLGVEPRLTSDAYEIRTADKVIFPGVGQASAAMDKLREYGLTEVIPDLKQPLLGICLGMQLLCRRTEEEDTDCLGIFPVDVKRFPDMKGIKIPHMGWNTIEQLNSPLMEGVGEKEYAYFVHSYYVEDSEYSIAKCNYALDFTAALNKDNFYGCQFHPEKSAGTGELILENFLRL